MRIEAILPDSHGAAAIELAEELGLTRSQLVEEALELFMKAVLEVRRGRRVMIVDPAQKEPDRELATPTITTLEWVSSPPLTLCGPALDRVAQLIENPPAPSPFLKEAQVEHRRRIAQAERLREGRR